MGALLPARYSSVQVGQQGDEESALEDAEVAAHGPRIEVEVLADSCPVDPTPGRAEHGVEDPAGDAGVQGLRREDAIPEDGERVRPHLVLPGGARPRQEGQRQGGEATGLEPSPQGGRPGRGRPGGGQGRVEEDVDEARRGRVERTVHLQGRERMQNEPGHPPDQGIAAGHRSPPHRGGARQQEVVPQGEGVDELLDRHADARHHLGLVDDGRPPQRAHPPERVLLGALGHRRLGERLVGGVGAGVREVARQARLPDGAPPLQDGDLVRGARRECLLNGSTVVRGRGHGASPPDAWENDIQCKNFPTSNVGFFRFVLPDWVGPEPRSGVRSRSWRRTEPISVRK